MFGTVYTLGYADPLATTKLAKFMQDGTTLLIDTRFKPLSRLPGWNGDDLRAKYGKRYRWAGKYLGNVNFGSSAPIQIADIETGITGLRLYLDEGYSVVLLCGCKDYAKCHRHVIVDALREHMPRLKIEAEEAALEGDTIKCLSICQPYAMWITNPNMFVDAQMQPKDIENRDWTTSYRGPLYIHAGQKFLKEDFDGWMQKCPELKDVVPMNPLDYPKGAIVGVVDLVDVVQQSNSPWFIGKYGFVLRNARAVEPIALRGQLKIFSVDTSVLNREHSKMMEAG